MSLQGLPPQCSPASVRAAMALRSSLTEVEWSHCSFIGFDGMADIGVTVLACCVWCVHVCGERQKDDRRERLCVCTLHVFVMVCLGACLCALSFEMYVFALCVHITCDCSYKVCGCLGVWVVRVLHLPLAGPLLKDFAIHLKHSRLRKVSFILCTLTSADVATLLAEGLSENRTLEQLYIHSHFSPEVSL